MWYLHHGTYIHTYIHTHTHKDGSVVDVISSSWNIHTYIHTYTHAHIPHQYGNDVFCIFKKTHQCIHIYIHTYIHSTPVWKWSILHLYKSTSIHTYIDTCTYDARVGAIRAHASACMHTYIHTAYFVSVRFLCICIHTYTYIRTHIRGGKKWSWHIHQNTAWWGHWRQSCSFSRNLGQNAKNIQRSSPAQKNARFDRFVHGCRLVLN
jgi:hypothetical protein